MNLRSLVCSAALVLSLATMVLFASPVLAHADGADSAVSAGLYYDASMPGNGIDVRETPDGGIFVAVYVGSSVFFDAPTWFSAQGAADAVSLDLLSTNAVFGDPGPQVLSAAGTIEFRPNDDGTVDAIVTISDPSGFSPPFAPIVVALHLSRLL